MPHNITTAAGAVETDEYQEELLFVPEKRERGRREREPHHTTSHETTLLTHLSWRMDRRLPARRTTRAMHVILHVMSCEIH